MMTDPLAHMLTRIRNAQPARHDSVAIASSRVKRQIARILKSDGVIRDYALPAEQEPDIQTQLRYTGTLAPGTTVATMLTGGTAGFEMALEVYGVGYRGQKQGDPLVLALGFSHPIELTAPHGVEIAELQTFSPTQANEWLSTRFTLRGIDKEKLGQFAAELRALRKPEPYKGKGVRYQGERVRRKAGKAAGKGGK